jgi:glutathione peroxidase
MIRLAIVGLALVSCAAQTNPPIGEPSNPSTTMSIPAEAKSIHGFKVASIDGKEIDFSSFKGKKILIVNTASECGFTRQYEGLEKLYQQYKEKLVVIGFPANNFGGQEPGSNEEIKSFCTSKFGVSFPMAAKVSVKGGDAAPIYQWLCSKEKNGVLDATISWNFNKFLIDENGYIIAKFDSRTDPMSVDITGKL